MEIGDHGDVRLAPNAHFDAVIKILDKQERRIVQQPDSSQRGQTLTTVRETRRVMGERCRKPEGNGLDVVRQIVELAAGEDSSDTNRDYKDANLVGMSAGGLFRLVGAVVVSPIGLIRKVVSWARVNSPSRSFLASALVLAGGEGGQSKRKRRRRKWRRKKRKEQVKMPMQMRSKTVDGISCALDCFRNGKETSNDEHRHFMFRNFEPCARQDVCKCN
jgi:hypothetical protein